MKIYFIILLAVIRLIGAQNNYKNLVLNAIDVETEYRSSSIRLDITLVYLTRYLELNLEHDEMYSNFLNAIKNCKQNQKQITSMVLKANSELLKVINENLSKFPPDFESLAPEETKKRRKARRNKKRKMRRMKNNQQETPATDEFLDKGEEEAEPAEPTQNMETKSPDEEQQVEDQEEAEALPLILKYDSPLDFEMLNIYKSAFELHMRHLEDELDTDFMLLMLHYADADQMSSGDMHALNMNRVTLKGDIQAKILKLYANASKFSGGLPDERKVRLRDEAKKALSHYRLLLTEYGEALEALN